ncbi:MAG TPA: hypothetical protein PLP71_11105 [Syntrophomonadaceae bacterium]|nr:hypothetical protein [Syntrophomonadaceae bacterium]
MKKRLVWITILTLISALFLVGCGSDQNTASDNNSHNNSDKTSALVEPAQLLTKQEAEEILGEPVKDAKVNTNPIGQIILFYEPVAETTSLRYVQLSVNQTAAMPEAMRESGSSAATLFADSKKLLEQAETVSGLGDDAFWGGSGLAAGAGLHVLKGDVYFTIDAALGDDAASREAAEKQAEKILSRL